MFHVIKSLFACLSCHSVVQCRVGEMNEKPKSSLNYTTVERIRNVYFSNAVFTTGQSKHFTNVSIPAKNTLTPTYILNMRTHIHIPNANDQKVTVCRFSKKVKVNTKMPVITTVFTVSAQQ